MNSRPFSTHEPLHDKISEILEAFQIRPSFGQDVPAEDLLVLDSVFNSYFKGAKSKDLVSAQYFNTGYRGISFTLKADTRQFMIVLTPGRVGLEDQSGAKIEFQIAGSTIKTPGVSVGRNRKYGEVALNAADLKKASAAFKAWMQSVSK